MCKGVEGHKLSGSVNCVVKLDPQGTKIPGSPMLTHLSELRFFIKLGGL